MVYIYSVIIVDDEKAICEGLGVLIPWESYGFKVNDYALNGKEALEKIKSGHFDLVLTDIIMPKLDGLELLRLMRENGHNEKAIVFSAYKEFEYARKAIKYGVKDYIVKPVDEEKLINIIKGIHKEITEENASSLTVNNSRQVLKSSLLLNLVEKGADKDTLNRMGKLNINVHGEHIYVYLAYCFTLVEQSKGENLLKVIDGIINKFCNGYVFEADENKICIIMSFSLNNLNYRSEIEKAVFYELNLLFPKQFILVSGNRSGSINEVKYSYIQACKVLKWALFYEKSGILSYEDIKREQNIENALSFKEFDNLKNALKNCGKEAVKELADKFFLNIQLDNLSLELVYSFYMNIMNFLKEMLNEVGENPERVIEEYQIESIDKMTLRELQQAVTKACIETMDFIKSTRLQSGNRVINRVLEYMNINYFKDLTLKDLSEEFHMNHVYLGKLFSEITGMHFPEYRNKLRIKQACRLLDTTDLKVYEVAEKVGYNDINYFFRNFREYVGISPNKYRKDT